VKISLILINCRDASLVVCSCVDIRRCGSPQHTFCMQRFNTARLLCKSSMYLKSHLSLSHVSGGLKAPCARTLEPMHPSWIHKPLCRKRGPPRPCTNKRRVCKYTLYIVPLSGMAILRLYNVVCACVRAWTGFRSNGDVFSELYFSSLMFQWEIQGVTGGTDQTSGECSLC